MWHIMETIAIKSDPPPCTLIISGIISLRGSERCTRHYDMVENRSARKGKILQDAVLPGDAAITSLPPSAERSKICSTAYNPHILNNK